MKNRKGPSYLQLIRYDKLTNVVQEAVLHPRANVQPEEHSEAVKPLLICIHMDCYILFT